MRAAADQAGIAESFHKGSETARAETPTTACQGVSGGVEFDLVIGTGRTELVGPGGVWRPVGRVVGGVVGPAEVDVGLLAVDITAGLAAGIGVVRVAGEFGWIAYRNFLEFVVRRLLLRAL